MATIFDGPRPKGIGSLLNHVPFDGCLLLFNAMAPDVRTKACDFHRRHGFKFHVHALTSLSRKQAHDRSVRTDLYVTVEG